MSSSECLKVNYHANEFKIWIVLLPLFLEELEKTASSSSRRPFSRRKNFYPTFLFAVIFSCFLIVDGTIYDQSCSPSFDI